MGKPFSRVGLIGWGATLGVVVAYDTWAICTKRPTMSASMGRVLAHPLLGPVVAAAWGGLTYHLVALEMLPAFFDENPHLPSPLKGISQFTSH